jgi:hypothetical protein
LDSEAKAIDDLLSELTHDFKRLALSFRVDLLDDAGSRSQVAVDGDAASYEECLKRVDDTFNSLRSQVEKVKGRIRGSKQAESAKTLTSILENPDVQRIASLLQEKRIQQYRKCGGEDDIAMELRLKKQIQQQTHAFLQSLALPHSNNVEIIANLKGLSTSYFTYFDQCSDPSKCATLCSSLDCIFQHCITLLSSVEASHQKAAQNEISVSISYLNNTLFDNSTSALKQIKTFSNTLQSLSQDPNFEPTTAPLSPRLPTLPPLPQFSAKRELPTLPQPTPVTLQSQSSTSETVAKFKSLAKADQAVALRKQLQQIVGSSTEFIELKSKAQIASFIALYPGTLRSTSHCLAEFCGGSNREAFETKLNLVNQALLKYSNALAQVPFCSCFF